MIIKGLESGKRNRSEREVVVPIYTVKKVSDFPTPSRDVTNQTLPGREKINYSRPGRDYIPAGNGEIANLFLQCTREKGERKEERRRKGKRR